MKKIILYLMITLLSISFVNAALIYEDDFNDNSLNTSYWTKTGTVCDEVNQRLQCSGGSSWGVNGVQGLNLDYRNYDNVTIEYTTDTSLDNTNQGMFGFGDGSGISYTTGEFLFYQDNTANVVIYEDAAAVDTIALTSAIYNFRIDIFNSSVAKYYYKLNSSSTWTLQYTSSKSASDTSMRPLFAHKQGLTWIDNFKIYSNSDDGSAPAPLVPEITIDDISLVNNSYHNSIIPIQLNLSVTDTNENVNTSYILYETFSDPLYNGSNISQSSITPLYTDTGTTRDQFCIENNYNSASDYTSSSYSNPAYYYTGASWALTTINTNKYNSITCQKEVQFGTNTLQPNTTLNEPVLIATPFKNTNPLSSEFFPYETASQYCLENYGSGFINYSTSTIVSVPMEYYNGSEWITVLGSTDRIVNLYCKGLPDGEHTIYFNSSNDETSTASETYTFTIDTINASVEYVYNGTEFNNYTIDMNALFSVSDINLDACTIDITDYENVTSPDTSTINCTDTFAFVHAGLHQLAVNATDLAGNYNDTTIINISVNPLVLVFFNDQFNSTIIKDYTSTIYHPDGRVVSGVIDSNGGTILSPVNNGSLDLGNHTITFSKIGYSTINVTVLINETNAGRNETFNVTRSKIIVNVYDRQTDDFLTGNTDITMVATFGFNGSTTTGNLNISNVSFLAETYQIIAEHTGYDTETVFFEYDNQKTLTVNIYMLNSTVSSTIIPRVITQTGQLISDARCSLLEWKPTSSAFVSVAQISTNVNGEGVFNVELNTKLYKIQCTKAGITVTSIPSSQIFTTDGAIIPIIFDESAEVFDSKLKDISYTLINTTINSTHQQVIFTWNDASNLVTQGCIDIYKKQFNSRLSLNSVCASGSSTNIQTIVNINNTYDLLVVGKVIDSNGLKEELDEIIFKATNSLQTIFSKYSLELIIPLISVLGAIAFGLSIKPQNIYISQFVLLIVIWGNYILFPSVMLLGTTIFVTFLDTLIIWGSYRVRK